MAPTERSPSAPARSMIDDRRPPRPSADAVQETAAGLLVDIAQANDAEIDKSWWQAIECDFDMFDLVPKRLNAEDIDIPEQRHPQ